MIQWKYIAVLLALMGVVLLVSRDSAVTRTFVEFSEDDGQVITANRSINEPVHMVVVFTKYNDELEDVTTPPDWADHLFDGENGSIDHYFDTISFGQIIVTGEVFSDVIELPRDTNYYRYSSTISNYTEDVLKELDSHPTFDYSRYDNDGPDGIPSSGDDDGYVDYLVLVSQGLPPRISESFSEADGLSTLGLKKVYTTNDKDVDFKLVKVRSSSGCIVSGESGFIMTSGVLSHEYLHSFGLPDLYDKLREKNNEASESGGIGFWGIMGYGSMGWDWQTGMMPPSAYSRLKLGIIGQNNDNLIDVYGIQRDLRLRSSSDPEGKIFRINLTAREYFLVEFRNRAGSYYDRANPGEGLLIWHVYTSAYNNGTEERKRVDLECADGKYADAGYPLGSIAKPTDGYDNIDFFSNKKYYRDQYAGNLGDATDVFDGETYTYFGPYTNPNTSTTENNAQSNVRIFNIRRDGDEMLFDVDAAPFVTWSVIPYPLNGIGFNRFNLVFEKLTTAAKPADAVYVVTPQDSLAPEKLVISYTDSIQVIPAGDLFENDIRNLIEHAFMGSTQPIRDVLLVRKNLSSDEITGEPDAVRQSLNTAPARVLRITAESGAQQERPAILDLHQNYPNPFNAETTIPFSLSEAHDISMDVFNVLGQRVRSINLGYHEPGMHTFRFAPDGFASGVYLVRLTGASQSATRRLVYMR